MRLSLRALASSIGISPAAVSFCLHATSKSMSLPQERRNIIIKAAKDLRYRPNEKLALLIDGHGNKNDLLRLQIIYSCQRAAEAQGLDIFLCEMEEGCVSPVIEKWQCAGVIILHSCCKKTIGAMEDRGIPYVIISPNENRKYNCIIPDERKGIEQALSYLCSCGCNTIVTAIPEIEHISYVMREQAIRDFAFSNPKLKIHSFYSKDYRKNLMAVRPLLAQASASHPMGMLTIAEWVLAYENLSNVIDDEQCLYTVSIKDMSSPWIPRMTTLCHPLFDIATSAIVNIKSKWHGAQYMSLSTTPDLIFDIFKSEKE